MGPADILTWSVVVVSRKRAVNRPAKPFRRRAVDEDDRSSQTAVMVP